MSDLEISGSKPVIGLCPTCGFQNGSLQIGRQQWLYCDPCKVAWHVTTDDRQTACDDDSRVNREKLGAYKIVQPAKCSLTKFIHGHLIAKGLMRTDVNPPVSDCDKANLVSTPMCGLTVAVIVPCHNYGHYLDECLVSILAQTRQPSEIVVVDDASTDNTPGVALAWGDRNVRYLRTEHRDVRLARQTGFLATEADIVCFVDADDRLPPDYLSVGMNCFGWHDIGVVYSDMQFFGLRSHRTTMPAIESADDIGATNYIHAASLVRREAIVMASALEIEADAARSHEDWCMWRAVLDQGWRAVKQEAVYQCRTHSNSSLEKKRLSGATYFDLAGLSHETITIAVPLSGRVLAWNEMQRFLACQTWPKDRTRLLLFDTSQDDAFGAAVHQWLAGCGYRDTRYISEPVGKRGLADAERRGHCAVSDDVRLAMAKIYNAVGHRVEGRYVLVIEDDVIPCDDDIVARLLRGFDEKTASVAAPYRSRYHDGFVAWRNGREIITERADGYETIAGNGFGCTMFRGHLLRSAVFTAMQPPYLDFDPAFYDRLPTGMKAKLCWSAECRHMGDGQKNIMRADNWPDAWRNIDLATYRASFLRGDEACRWLSDSFNGKEPFAFISLGDGEIAWWAFDDLVGMYGVSRHWLDCLARSTGLYHSDRSAMMGQFESALHAAHEWPIVHDWQDAERFCAVALSSRGVAIERDAFMFNGSIKRKVDANAVYRLPAAGLWWPMLSGKRLAIVGSCATEIAKALRNQDFVTANGGPQIDWQIHAVIRTPDKATPKAAAWPAIKQKMERSDWMHMLCAAGGLSVIICDHARRMGRHAVDIGQLANAILGEPSVVAPFHTISSARQP